MTEDLSVADDTTVRAPEPGPIVIVDADQKPILTVHPDGRVTLDQPDKADEAAHTFVDSLSRLLACQPVELGPPAGDVAGLIRAQKSPCLDHPWPLPKPSCWVCARNGAFERSARIAEGGDDV